MDSELNQITDQYPNDQIIDILLTQMCLSPNLGISVAPLQNNLRESRISQIIGLMQYHDLARMSGQPYDMSRFHLELRDKGVMVVNQGGWLAYISRQQQQDEEQKQRALEAHQALLASTKAAQSSASAATNSANYSRHSRNGAWIAAIGAVLAAIVPFFRTDTVKPNLKMDSTVSVLTRKVDTLYSRLKGQAQSRKSTAVPQQMKKTR